MCLENIIVKILLNRIRTCDSLQCHRFIHTYPLLNTDLSALLKTFWTDFIEQCGTRNVPMKVYTSFSERNSSLSKPNSELELLTRSSIVLLLLKIRWQVECWIAPIVSTSSPWVRGCLLCSEAIFRTVIKVTETHTRMIGANQEILRRHQVELTKDLIFLFL